MKNLAEVQPPNSRWPQTFDKGMIMVLVSATIIGIAYFMAQANRGFLYLISNWLPPLLAFVTLVPAVAGLVKFGVSRNRFSIIWLGYSIGVLFWLLGESTWALYALWYSIPVPFPSIADEFWLVGYVPLISAMLILAWPFREFFSSRRMVILVLAVFALAGLLLLTLIPPTYKSEIGQNLVAVVVGLAYPLLDVSLLLVALPLLLLFRGGTFWRPFLIITIGLILTLIGDVLFTWTTLSSVYYDGSYLELFFHWSYLTLAYGFYLRLRNSTRGSMLE